MFELIRLADKQRGSMRHKLRFCADGYISQRGPQAIRRLKLGLHLRSHGKEALGRCTRVNAFRTLRFDLARNHKRLP
jgi:hypothetical protein